uniref:Protein kinase domain-containing protein n=1 Tax=Populus trichocarpa TaxID=3694 RepID=A0A2K1XGJ2_POPTR
MAWITELGFFQADEVVFEAIVKDSNRSWFRRKLMYHSYSMQVMVILHLLVAVVRLLWYMGYVLFLYWLPTLKANLALDEESVRRVGDDTVGGPAVYWQLRITRILMRDLLIGVNYLHSHGLSDTELRLENVHISPVDRHIKVNASFPPSYAVFFNFRFSEFRIKFDIYRIRKEIL